MVVTRAIVRLTALYIGLQFVSKGGGPFPPSKVASSRELHGQRKRLSLPWLGEYRSVRIARQPR